ncbi:IS630 transposase-related protein [Kingella negevensis]|uniref:Transposase n=3 Tax=Kingella negevensis TaxID=1522312 RepID=A0A238TD37_9NEIS|nr:IS630 transposase-related protein [Kingella negevensis]MDK4679548.1 IS630 transposase-related protein [Kingella negevensis]MDK4682734.1 IS630 transposase-related protein [Kingella negevensis]MDK4690931.1 IS630 transposase-related protein [Kingella negevensis]MDK4693922.1 IS630 transposase-related protein [Kingella negevensis]MDK4696708.1 IS630 transposase-related protein [Kingella negevensis]
MHKTAYSIDLREKALNCYKQCNNASKVAKTYGISRNTLYLWIKLEEQTGSLKHQVKGQNATKLDTQALKQYIEQNPDAYLYENARFHRMGILQEMVHHLGHKILPLAPYSPELNPIEKTWANIKKYMRSILPSYDNFTDALLSYLYFN